MLDMAVAVQLLLNSQFKMSAVAQVVEWVVY